MQWSKLKTRLKAFIAPELSERVDFHFARYRNLHDQPGRVWFTIDKVEVAECSELKWWKNFNKTWDTKAAEGLPFDAVRMASHETNKNEGVFDERECCDLLSAFLDMSITDALKTKNPLIRAFAMIDRRLGKRTFEKIHLSENEHPLVRAFYELRSQVFNFPAHSHN